MFLFEEEQEDGKHILLYLKFCHLTYWLHKVWFGRKLWEQLLVLVDVKTNISG